MPPKVKDQAPPPKKRRAPYELGHELYFNFYFANQVKGLETWSEMDEGQQRFVQAHLSYLNLRQLGALTIQVQKANELLDNLPDEFTANQMAAMRKLQAELEERKTDLGETEEDGDADEGKAGGEDADANPESNGQEDDLDDNEEEEEEEEPDEDPAE